MRKKMIIPPALFAMLFALCSFAEARAAAKIPKIGLLKPVLLQAPRLRDSCESSAHSVTLRVRT